jgi:hypothetical protein
MIKSDSVEKRQVLQRSKKNASQNRPKVDPLLCTVFKHDLEDMRSDDFKPGDAMDGVAHGLSERIDFDWRLTGLQQIPSANQFLVVNFHPCLNETTLWSR